MQICILCLQEYLNANKPNGLSHPYTLGESICHLRVSVYFFHFCSMFLKFLQAKSKDLDQTPHNAASDLGLHCLPMSHKRDARLIWV